MRKEIEIKGGVKRFLLPFALILSLSLIFTSLSNEFAYFHTHDLTTFSCDSHESHDEEDDTKSTEFCPYYVWNANSSDQITPLFFHTITLSFTAQIYRECTYSYSHQQVISYSSRAPPSFS